MRIFLDALSRIPTVSIGTQALIIGCLQILQRRFPGAEFVMLSNQPDQEQTYLSGTGYPLEYVQRSASQRGFWRQLRELTASADAVVSAWGDGYVGGAARQLLVKSLALRHRDTPVVLVSASVGPFRGGLEKQFARWGLGCFDTVVVRDHETRRFVEALGLSQVHCLPDTAFVVETAPPDEVAAILLHEGIPPAAPLVALNPSILLHHRCPIISGQAYAAAMAALVDHLRQVTQCAVLLVPHQIYPASYPGLSPELKLSYDGDDRAAGELIWQALGDQKDVYQLTGEYSPAQYKGLLSRCQMLVAGRMHAVIAATAMGVPSAIMQYSHKAQGVMEMLGMADWIWNCGESLSTLQSLTECLWSNREAVSQHLTGIMPDIQAQAYAIGDLVAAAGMRTGKRA